MEKLPTVVLEQKVHRRTNQLLIKFTYNESLIALVKTIPNVTWSLTLKSWYLENNSHNLKAIFSTLKGKALINTKDIPLKKEKVRQITTKQAIPKAYELLLTRRRYSPNTIKVYVSFLKSFISFLKSKKIEDATESDIRKYQDYLVTQKKVAISTQNQAINAIKFYFEKVLGNEKKTYYIERPRKPKKLPKVLSELQVFKILRCTDNYKHKFIISLLYSSGLRISELLALRKKDLLPEKNLIFVRAAKGKKDRTTIFAENLKKLHLLYLKIYKPNYWLFEGTNRSQYSTTSVGNIIKKSAMKAGIEQAVTAHMFRHSFATHLLEQGVGLRYIQNILGHSSSKTTEIYTQVSSYSLAKIKSPLDSLIEHNKLNNNN